MAYGLHWEWRGFGELDEQVRDRITRLRSVNGWDRTIRDRYLWYPGCRSNVKLRSWGAREGLKFKRLIEEDGELGLQLWLERQEEDFLFPIEPQVVHQLGRLLQIELPLAAPLPRSDDLIDGLSRLSDQIRVVVVEKSRSTFAWQKREARVLVDLAEIHSPVATMSVGLENLPGIEEPASRAALGAARDSVAAARAELGLPGGLVTLSYLEALAQWVGNEE
jgi:hypothetical protein